MGLDALTVYFAAGCVLVFVAGVGVIAPWWRSPVGRTMMYLSVALLVTLVPSVLHFAVGVTLSRPWFAWFYRGALLSLGVIHLWRLLAFWRIQREGRRSGRVRPP